MRKRLAGLFFVVLALPCHGLADFDYPLFSSTAGLNLVSNATGYNNRLRLTPSKEYQVGAAWFIAKQEISLGFETIFQFQITELGPSYMAEPGADGFAFVIQNVSPVALGGVGGAIGYGNNHPSTEERGIPNSIAIEFDTWANSEAPDPSGNHISVQTRGALPNDFDHTYSLGCAFPTINMSDGNIHTVKIKYAANTMSIFLDDLTTPVLIFPLVVSSILQLDGRSAWVGFTSATGGAWENHDIINWSFSTMVGSHIGGLYGIVRDQLTGQPIEGATVSLPSIPPVFTNPSGQFEFLNLPVGQTAISASKAGYYPATQTVVINQASTTAVTIDLRSETTGPNPVITDLSGNFCSPTKDAYFLDTVPFNQTFTTTIDWKGHTPGQIKWILPDSNVIEPVSSNTASKTFDMGVDFGVGGKLKVVAIAADSAQSNECAANFDIIPFPPSISNDPQVAANWIPVPIDQGFEYRFLLLREMEFDLATWGADRVETGFPFFGGQEMKVGIVLDKDPGPFSATLSGTVDSDGKAKLFTLGWDAERKKPIRKGVHCRKGIKLPFVEASPRTSLEIDYNWSKELNQWMPGGEFELGCEVKWSSPQIPLGAIVIVPVYMRSECSLDLALDVGVQGWDPNGPQWAGSFEFEPLLKVILGAGIAGWVCVEGYLGGGFHSEIAFLPVVKWQNTYIILVGGVQAVAGPFYAGPFELRYEWPKPEQESMIAMVSMNKLLRSSEFRLLPRDYLNYPNPVEEILRLIPDLDRGEISNIMSTASTGNEHPIQPVPVLFPYSVPDVVGVGNDVLAVWLADDTRRSLINRTELTFARYRNGVWTSSSPVADDGTADMNPQLVSLPGGNAACIWQNANVVLEDSNDFKMFNSHLEVAASTYDAGSGTWSSAIRLTHNLTLDRSPRLAAAAANDMLAAWVNNASNDMWGSVTATNTIMWSHYNGTAWSSPSAIASGIGTILDTALAYNGTTGTFIFCTDADDNLDDSNDQELWVATYSGGLWSAPTRLTNDVVTDAAPRLAYDAGNTLILAWLKGNDIRFTTGTDVVNSTVVVTPGESMSSKDFDFVMGQNGRIALVWNDVSETYNDMWISYYESAQSAWSRARQLTHDDAAERFISGMFDSNDNLFCVYDKTQTVYQDRQEMVNGQPVIVKGVPSAGQSDLYYISYHLQNDLAVAVEDVYLTPANPLPGTEATISATVKNLGESVASNIDVAFYDGDPEFGGILIDSIQHIAGPLVGGDDVNVSVDWVVPDSNTARTLYVVVDPNMAQEDRNWTNNKVSFNILVPDLTITQINVQTAGPHSIITARVANEGVLPVTDVDVVMRKQIWHGAILGEDIISDIAPGAYRDVAFVWSYLPMGASLVYVEVDTSDSIDEFDEDNNVRYARVENFSNSDFNHDAEVDLTDLARFVAYWLNEDCNKSGRCENTDMDLSGKVDFVDWALFAEDWMKHKSQWLIGDFDLDSIVDFFDYAKFAVHWKQDSSNPGWCEAYDISKNGIIDFGDLAIFAENWLEGTTP